MNVHKQTLSMATVEVQTMRKILESIKRLGGKQLRLWVQPKDMTITLHFMDEDNVIFVQIVLKGEQMHLWDDHGIKVDRQFGLTTESITEMLSIMNAKSDSIQWDFTVDKLEQAYLSVIVGSNSSSSGGSAANKKYGNSSSSSAPYTSLAITATPHNNSVVVTAGNSKKRKQNNDIVSNVVVAAVATTTTSTAKKRRKKFVSADEIIGDTNITSTATTPVVVMPTTNYNANQSQQRQLAIPCMYTLQQVVSRYRMPLGEPPALDSLISLCTYSHHIVVYASDLHSVVTTFHRSKDIFSEFDLYFDPTKNAIAFEAEDVATTKRMQHTIKIDKMNVCEDFANALSTMNQEQIDNLSTLKRWRYSTNYMFKVTRDAAECKITSIYFNIYDPTDSVMFVFSGGEIADTSIIIQHITTDNQDPM